MRPARSSISNRLRHTMSRKAPLGCFHCQASHSFFDSVRWLWFGYAAISLHKYRMSSVVLTRPRYLSSAIDEQYESVFLERKGVGMFFHSHFNAFTRRHIGAARTRGTSPAAISNCPSYVSSPLAGPVASGHHTKRPRDNRFCASQYPCPSYVSRRIAMPL